MKKITPCLWFDTQALEAAEFYTTVFPRSKILEVTHFPEGGPKPKGTVLTVRFRLDDQDFLALNGGDGQHFNPAVSLSVDCKSQKQVDRFWSRLTEGGKEGQCGWLTDRYGLSWQIVPRALPRLLDSKDSAKAARAMKSMMTMKKIDVATVQKAAKAKASKAKASKPKAQPAPERDAKKRPR